MTTLFTRTLLKGIADGMTDAGAMAPFASDDLAFGVFDKIASDMKLPEVLTEHLPNDTYVKIGQWILNASETAGRQGLVPSASTQAMAKQASHMPLEERAMKIAAFVMAKTANEASLTPVGENTPESATATNALAALDQKNRSSLQYLVGHGKTDMPEGGAAGRLMPHPQAPKGPSINNSLTHLSKQAAECVGRASTFVQGLARRGAHVGPKMVLASAALAESGTPGLEVMTHIVETVKTAEELDGMLDHVMQSQEAHGAEPDPTIVAAIEQVLMEHGLLDGGGEGLPEGGAPAPDDEGGEGGESGPPDPKTAAAKDALNSMKKKAKGAATSAKNKAQSAASSAKNKAQEAGSSIADTAKKHGPAALAGAAVGAVGGAAAMSGSRNKEAQLLAVLKAAAEGSLTEVEENTPESAAKDNANAELDLKNRKPEEYLTGAGQTEMPNIGHVGASMDAPKGPEKVNPDTTPARETKSASYDETVKRTAAEWGPKLPLTMSPNEKRAHVLALAGMPSDLRDGYVQELSKG